MKKYLLKIAALMAIAITACMPASAQDTSITTPTADTYVRKNNTTNYGAATTMEIQTYTNTSDATKSTDFVGLMSFEFTQPSSENNVKSAILRLVTERIKGNATMNIYAFNSDFTESSKYADLEAAITSARAKNPIATFKMAGEWNKAIDADAVSDSYTTVDTWTNTIDLSDYVKTLSTNKFSIMITRSTDENNSNKIFTKEAVDFTNSKGTPFTFSAADLAPRLTVSYEKNESKKTSITTSTADTYLRKNNTANHGAETTMEIQTYTNTEDASKSTDFVGLLSFQFPQEALSATIKSATIRLVTERVKADVNMNVYAYSGSFAEDAKYADQESFISASRTTTPITTFAAKCQKTKSIVLDAVGDDYKTVSAWTNNIDVTEYVKTLKSNLFSIMITSTVDNNNSEKFFTKEATDFTNAKDATITFAATDLVPQLTVIYENGTSGIINATTSDNNHTPKGIYTLQGIKLKNIPQSGIYIINGKKTFVRK